MKTMAGTLRLDRLVGRTVYTANNRRLGRLHEFRVERQGTDWLVTEYIIGAVGLVERLGLGVRLVLGLDGPPGYRARWDQIEFSNPNRPRLTSPVDELRRQ